MRSSFKLPLLLLVATPLLPQAVTIQDPTNGNRAAVTSGRLLRVEANPSTTTDFFVDLRKLNGVTLTGANVVDGANSAFRVNVVAGGAGGGVAQLQVRNSGDAAWVNIGVGAEGAAVLKLPVRLHDATGNIAVVTNAAPAGGDYGLGIRCISGCGASSFLDNSAFTAGASSITNIGGVFNDGLAAVTSGNAAAPRITDRRGLHVNLRNNAGTEVATSADPLRVDPTGTTTQPTSISAANFPDNEPFNLNQLAGTVLAAPVDVDLGAGAEQIIRVSMRKAASGGSVEYGTSTDPLRVDPTGATTQPVSGTVTANAGAGNFNVVGTKSNNGGAPGSTNLGVLPAVATAGVPTQTEGNQVGLSTNLAGSLRALITDALPTGANNIGDVDVLTLPANASVNLNQIAGTGVTANNGAAGAGSQRNVLANDNSAIANWGHGAVGGAVPSGATVLGLRDDAGNTQRGIFCDLRANVDIRAFTAAESFQFITGVASQKVYFCHISIMASAASNVKITEGTGTNCATGKTTISGAWPFAANGGIAQSFGIGPLVMTTAANNVCAESSAAVSVTVLVQYALF